MDINDEELDSFELPYGLNKDGSFKDEEQEIDSVNPPGKKEVVAAFSSGADIRSKSGSEIRRKRSSDLSMDNPDSRRIGRSMYFRESFYEKIRLCAFAKQMSIAKYIISCVESQVVKDFRSISNKKLVDFLND